MTNPTEKGALGGVFDEYMRALTGIPDATSSKATTLRSVTPIKQLAQTFIVQTIRHRERGDTIFVEYLDADGSLRVALPPAVADAIARQRESLATKNRKRAARERAVRDKAAGVVPGFMRKKSKTKKKEASS